MTSSIWVVRVPSKPISHENGYHMHFLARNNHKFKFHNKETHNWNITTTSTNHRVRYGVRSELCLTLQHNRGVRETTTICWFKIATSYGIDIYWQIYSWFITFIFSCINCTHTSMRSDFIVWLNQLSYLPLYWYIIVKSLLCQRRLSDMAIRTYLVILAE